MYVSDEETKVAIEIKSSIIYTEWFMIVREYFKKYLQHSIKRTVLKALFSYLFIQISRSLFPDSPNTKMSK